MQSAPLIDISDRSDWQTVVDREKGQYLGHVTTALMPDGRTIYAVYPKCHAVGQIVLKRSDDGGRTWSERLPVPASFSESLECPTIYRLEDRAGASRLFIFSGGYPGKVSRSEDGGRTWTEAQRVGDYGGIVFLSCVEALGGGEYLAMFHDEGEFIRGGDAKKYEVYCAGSGADRRSGVISRTSEDGGKTWSEKQRWWVWPAEKPGDRWEKVYEARCGRVFADRHFELYQIRSHDGGLTWSRPEMIANHPEARLCEPCIVHSPDRKRLAVLLRDNSRKFHSFVMLGDARGENWSEPVQLPAELTGDRHTVAYLPDGRLFITFRDMAPASETKGDWVAWVGTFEDIVGLRPGQYRVLIKKNEGWDCAYPGVHYLEDGAIAATTYGHWEAGESPYIVCVRIPLRALDEMYQRQLAE